MPDAHDSKLLHAWLREQWRVRGRRSLHVGLDEREGGDPDAWVADGFAAFTAALVMQGAFAAGPVVSLVFALDTERELRSSGLSDRPEEWKLPLGMTPPEIVLDDSESWREVVGTFRQHGTIMRRLLIGGVPCGAVFTFRVDRYPSGDDVVRHLWIVPMKALEAAGHGLQA
ncbi:MAG: hypothetical protein KIT19_13750 [Phycisphaeraceae bacterium]|nr:hypothetical protein [Phycisphaeraceae bacterium]